MQLPLNKTISLYIHIPFCFKKCDYCAFVSLVSNDDKKEKYFLKLKKELNFLVNKGYRFKTLYIGGGSPLNIGVDKIIELIDLASLNKKIDEVSIESNPYEISEEVILKLNNKITRLSTGFQSLYDDQMKIIGRNCNQEDNKAALKIFRKNLHNFDLNFDFILNISSFDRTIDSLNQILDIKNLNHLSLYSLTIEDKSALAKNNFQTLSEDEQIENEKKIFAFLKEKNFDHYEISSYAKNSKYCLHNQVYWALDDYLGLGISAGSFYDNAIHSCNISLDEYITKDIFQTYSSSILSNPDAFQLFLMVALRTKKKILFSKIKEKFSIDLKNEMKDFFSSFDSSLYYLDNDGFNLTQEGFHLCDLISKKLIYLLMDKGFIN